ncbi:MAG: M24 family metallopeptidase [Phycisphaerales bacterium]|nr:M24 family metallopeptidase [Phycisphaerales bacterium]
MPRSAEGIRPADAAAAYDAAQAVVETHRRVADFLRVGLTLAEIDAFVAKTLADLSCRSCFLGYKVPRTPAFPCHACLSVNDCIVHGTVASFTRPLIEGDLLKVDIGVWRKGWIGDAAWTYSLGEPGPEVRRLMDVGKESIRRGVQAIRPSNQWIDWARTVQGYVEGDCGLHLVEGLGGHGIGRTLHGKPFVSNVVPVWPMSWPEGHQRCAVGTLVAVEPMIAIGTSRTKTDPVLKWPISTADGSLAVHYEHDILVTEDGPRILTEGLDDLRDVVG